MEEDFALLVSGVDLVEVGEGITIFGMAEERGRKASGRGKEKADSSCLASLGRRNDKTDSSCLASLGRRNDKAGDCAAVGIAGRSARATQSHFTRICSTQAFDRMTPKELGEFAEAEFLRTALGMGMAVTKPWGESQGYDFIVDATGKLTRVQVKAAFRQGRQGGYSLRTYRSSKECYTAREIDALAGYVAPLDAWYLFPVWMVRRVRSLKLFPGSKQRRSKFERWREAWWVLGGGG
jgi:hypothetical protein